MGVRKKAAMITVQRSVGEFYAKLPNKGVGGIAGWW